MWESLQTLGQILGIAVLVIIGLFIAAAASQSTRRW
jgi:hypothetical protein